MEETYDALARRLLAAALTTLPGNKCVWSFLCYQFVFYPSIPILIRHNQKEQRRGLVRFINQPLLIIYSCTCKAPRLCNKELAMFFFAMDYVKTERPPIVVN